MGFNILSQVRDIEKIFYPLGRALQVISLIALPSAIWAGQVGGSMIGELGISASALLIFFAGWVMVRVGSK